MAVKYNLPPEAYYPGGITILKATGEAEARKEYQRLRRIAQKRLARFEGTQYEDTDVYKNRAIKHPFKPSSSIKDARSLQAALSDVRGFLDSERSTITGLKRIDKKTVSTLQANGYTFVNMGNIKAFGEFMEAARIKAGRRMFASDRVAELYDAAERKKIPPEQLLKDFEYWRKNVEELNSSRVSRKEGATAADYRRTIERRKAKSGTVAQRRKKRGG